MHNHGIFLARESFNKSKRPPSPTPLHTLTVPTCCSPSTSAPSFCFAQTVWHLALPKAFLHDWVRADNTQECWGHAVTIKRLRESCRLLMGHCGGWWDGTGRDGSRLWEGVVLGSVWPKTPGCLSQGFMLGWKKQSLPGICSASLVTWTMCWLLRRCKQRNRFRPSRYLSHTSHQLVFLFHHVVKKRSGSPVRHTLAFT